MDLDNAIHSHYEWKSKFKAAIAAQSKLDASSIARDDCCEFGKWLHGDAGRLYSNKAEFMALLAKHKTFHQEAGKVAQAINQGHYEEAAEMMANSTPFVTASMAVGVAVNALKRIAANV